MELEEIVETTRPPQRVFRSSMLSSGRDQVLEEPRRPFKMPLRPSFPSGTLYSQNLRQDNQTYPSSPLHQQHTTPPATSVMPGTSPKHISS